MRLNFSPCNSHGTTPVLEWTSPETLLTAAFVLALVVGLLLKFWLASRQIRHVSQLRDAVPDNFAHRITLGAHRKAADYTIAKTRFGLVELAIATGMTLGWTLLGGLDALNTLLLRLGAPAMAQQLLLIGAFAMIGGLMELLLNLYQTFGIEARFGFNTMTPRLWLADLVRSVLLGCVIGLPIAALVLWLMGTAGGLWWLWAWAAWMVFNLLLLMIYPTYIAPLFNKFKPLEDETLKRRVGALMQRCGYTAKGLFVMDGSRRSAHANAYFTGIGAAKRVVFYDTLLARLSPEEVDAVLAHELGHFKYRHILKRIAAMFLLSLLGFALLGWLSGQMWFYTGLGVQPHVLAGVPNDALALLLFMLVAPMFGQFVTPVFAQLSRRHEFEADAYAIAQTSSADLSAALLKLYQDNASTLTPDPVYAKFYYSHPPATERLAKMSS
ncbi:MAG: M48 family metallopeptidase [Rhodanobacteraceae bacterium]|nr:M48 family metallopeptidase [Rhodanobacteraceae bacterium]